MLLLDLQMPHKNGLQALEEIRDFYRHLRCQNLPFEVIEPEYIFLTAFRTIAFKNHLQKINVEHCYEKPVSDCQMRYLLEKYSGLPIASFEQSDEQNQDLEAQYPRDNMDDLERQVNKLLSVRQAGSGEQCSAK